jgi:magnesium and cobalt exporter, CNNM family
MTFTMAGLLLMLAVSLMLSAFFAAAETALVSLSRLQLQGLIEQGVRQAPAIRSLKERPGRMLATILVGQNLLNSAASALATGLAIGLLGRNAGIGVATVAMTILIFVFCEMLPKSFATGATAATARAVAPPVAALTRLLGPPLHVVTVATSKLLHLFGLPETRPAFTEEEMKSVINLGHAAGVIHGEEARLLNNVLAFGDRTAGDLMAPRTKIVAVPETATFADVRQVLRLHKYSRLPVYRGTLDNIVGILHAKDLFDVTDAEERTFELTRHVHPAYLVTEFKRAEELFREMRRRRDHMAIVVDEYGGTAGLVTIEDVIESLLGSIEDEYDEAPVSFVPVEDRTYLLEGATRLADLADKLGVRFPSEHAETVAGYLLFRLGHIPRKGERLRTRQAELIVEEATPTAIRKVRMILPRAHPDSPVQSATP